MTSVRFTKHKDGSYRSFEVSGHSGYSDAGSDIVCAAVSAATELVMAILEQFSVDFRTEITEESARVFCELCENAANKAKRSAIDSVLNGYSGYLKEVSAAYPKNLKCIITEI